MSTTPRILMCPPDYFAIEYEINAWMHREHPADSTIAQQQWRDLVRILASLGATIEQLMPVNGLPDLVFTANAGLVYQRQVILSHFLPKQRQGEEPINRAWFEQQGFMVVDPPSNMHFEGAGDALFCGATLYAGYRFRSDALGHQHIGALLGCRVIPVELVDPRFYHLDTCFCPLTTDTAAWYPPAFDRYGQQAIQASVPHLIAVEPEEAASFACNAVVVGRHVVTNTGCPRFHEQLLAQGFSPIATPLGEFVKSGGSAKCLTLRLDGEEAAAWRVPAIN